jgi:hypothetical protein
VIAYRATVDVPRELVQYLGRLLAAERRAKGTRRGTRALTCFYQALLVLVWFRKAEDLTLLGAGFGISRATAYRYRDEAGPRQSRDGVRLEQSGVEAPLLVAARRA